MQKSEMWSLLTAPRLSPLDTPSCAMRRLRRHQIAIRSQRHFPMLLMQSEAVISLPSDAAR